jgi:hypothetical protein
MAIWRYALLVGTLEVLVVTVGHYAQLELVFWFPL